MANLKSSNQTQLKIKSILLLFVILGGQLTGSSIHFKNKNCYKGDGFCIFVSRLESFDVLNNDCLSESSEQILCSINSGSEMILCGCIYRAPSAKRITTR